MIRAWGRTLSGWRWLYTLQPISDAQRDWGFQIVRGSADQETPVSSPGCRSCSDTE